MNIETKYKKGDIVWVIKLITNCIKERQPIRPVRIRSVWSILIEDGEPAITYMTVDHTEPHPHSQLASFEETDIFETKQEAVDAGVTTLERMIAEDIERMDNTRRNIVYWHECIARCKEIES